MLLYLFTGLLLYIFTGLLLYIYRYVVIYLYRYISVNVIYKIVFTDHADYDMAEHVLLYSEEKLY